MAKSRTLPRCLDVAVRAFFRAARLELVAAPAVVDVAAFAASLAAVEVEAMREVGVGLAEAALVDAAIGLETDRAARAPRRRLMLSSTTISGRAELRWYRR